MNDALAIVAAVGGAGLALMAQAARGAHKRKQFKPPGQPPVEFVRPATGVGFPPESGDAETARFHIRYGVGDGVHQWHSDNTTHAKLVWDIVTTNRDRFPGALEFFDGDHRRGHRAAVAP